MQPLAEVTFDSTPEGSIALYRRQLLRSPFLWQSHRRTLRNGVIAGLISTALLGAFGYVTARDPSQAVARTVLFSMVGVLVWSWHAVRNLTWRGKVRLMNRLVERGVKNGSLATVPGPCHVAVMPDALVVTTSVQSQSFPWTAAKGVERTADATYVDFEAEAMVRIPHRAFADAGERDRFAELLLEQAGVEEDCAEAAGGR